MGHRAWALLERRFRPARHLHQHFQGFDHRLLAHLTAADCAEPAFLVGDATVARRHSKVYEADRLAGRGTAGTGDAGDRHREIGVCLFQRTDGHSHGGLLANGPESRKGRGLNAEHRVLGLVGIGDEATIDDIGRSWNFRQRAGDKTAGAGLGGHDGQLAHTAKIEQRTGEGASGAAAHASCSHH
ncbi:hypothetical protein ASC80_07210 [Afipia sp. Root123D2]|nr:hypothetical protein ASC80_07210 [Afipia sp. Root123D2]